MSYEELKNLSNDELTNELIKMDFNLMQDHKDGRYIRSFWMDGKSNPDKNIDIINLCIVGICAYNKLSNLHTSHEFINYVIDNIEMFLEHGNIPSFMQDYYIDIFNRGKVDYLNNYLVKHDYEDESVGKGKGALTKSTAVGRALSEKESAFVSVLVLPAMLALIYISVVVIYFVFFYRGG